MTFDAFSQQLYRYQRRTAVIAVLLEVAITLSGIALVAILLYSVSPIGGVFSIVLGCAIFCVLLVRRRWLSLPRFEDSCVLIDEKLGLQNRATSLFYARSAKLEGYQAISAIIEQQLSALCPAEDVRALLSAPAPKKKIGLLIGLIVALAIIIFLKQPKAINSESEKAAESLETLIEENPAIPEKAAEELRSLADTVREAGLGSQVVEDKILSTLAAFDDVAKEGEAKNNQLVKEENGEADPLSAAAPTATPTPTPTPTPTVNTSKSALPQQKEVDVQHGQKSKEEKDGSKDGDSKESDPKEKEDSKKQDGGNDSKENESKSTKKEESDNSTDKGSSSEEKSDKGSSEEGKGDSPQQGKSEQSGNSPGSSGKSGDDEGKQGSSSSGSQGGQQQGQEGGEGGDGGSQAGGQEGQGKDPGPQGSASNQGQAVGQQEGTQRGAGGKSDAGIDGEASRQGKGSGSLTSALEQAREKVASLSQSGEKQDQSEKNDKNKSEQSPSSRSGEGVKGEKGGGKNKDKVSPSEKNESRASGGKGGEQSDESSVSEGQDGGDSEGDSENDTPGQSATLGGSSPDKFIKEGEGKGLEGPKGFKNAPVQENNLEQVDARFGVDTGAVVEHNNRSEFKRSLQAIPLAKPDAVVGQRAQPIPLEYRGVLGEE